jgi:arginyl-tRNA synthetase
MDYKEEIANILSKHVPLKKEEILKLIEVPKVSGFGDYAFPCFSLAPLMRKSPNEVASRIASSMGSTENIIVTALNAYINFSINKEMMAHNIISKILKEKERFGSSNEGKGMKVLIEHTSINPNSPPHVGTARNAIIGDILVRLLKFQGYDVEAHYYVNDIGKQMGILVLGAKGNESFDKMLDVYVRTAKRVEKNKKLEKKVFEILKKFEEGDKSTTAKLNKIVKRCLEGQKSILNELKVKFDVFDYESRYLRKDKQKIQDLLDKLKDTSRLFVDEEGRVVLDEKGFGLENEMRNPVLVLTRSDGTSLYPLRDMAYTIDKMKVTENNIIVLGEEHKLHYKQIQAALKLLGYNPIKTVHYSFILLSTEEGKKKMSKRRGEVVLLGDFIAEAVKKAKDEIKKRKLSTIKAAKDIGIAAVRYSIAKVEENKNIIFNWKDALNFEGNSGPYLQYTHARASNILKKAKKKTAKPDFSMLRDEKEKELITILSKFPEIADNAATNLGPHVIAHYAQSLAEAFNSFYQSCPVINAGPGLRGARLAVVEASRQVLENVLNILGIKALKRM